MKPEGFAASRQGITRAFESRFGRRPEVVVRAPGRVNLLGAHVDTSEGWVLPAAIDRAVWLAAAVRPPGQGREMCLAALDLEAEAALELDHLPPPRPERGGDGSWADLPAGLAWALQASGYRLPALEVAFSSDLPMGAGVSSSAAVEMAFLLAWETLAARAGEVWRLSGIDRARFGQRAENDYLGVRSGIMDQFASLHGQRGRAILLDCRTLEHRLVPIPDSVAVLVADSGVRRRLEASGFNDRQEEARRALAGLRELLPRLRTLRDLSVEDLELWEHRLEPDLRRRARHVVEENLRVRAGAKALEADDLEAFGAFMQDSHRSSRDLFEVSLPELDELAAAAWRARGCLGARLSGGGFGGCVTALVRADAVEEVSQSIRSQFEGRFGRSPDLWLARIRAGASIESGG